MNIKIYSKEQDIYYSQTASIDAFMSKNKEKIDHIEVITDLMGSEFNNLKYAMCIQDNWISNGNGASRLGFTLGQVYEIINEETNKYVVNKNFRHYLPMGDYKNNNKFFKYFILVDKKDVIINPYSNIKQLKDKKLEIIDKINKLKAEYQEELNSIDLDINALTTTIII